LISPSLQSLRSDKIGTKVLSLYFDALSLREPASAPLEKALEDVGDPVRFHLRLGLHGVVTPEYDVMLVSVGTLDVIAHHRFAAQIDVAHGVPHAGRIVSPAFLPARLVFPSAPESWSEMGAPVFLFYRSLD
jgi:hypothetical protein